MTNKKIMILILFNVLFALTNKREYNISNKYSMELKKLNKHIVLFGKDVLKNKNYIDFGVVGQLYDIKEKNFLIDYEEEKHKLKKYLSKKYIKEQLEKNIKRVTNFRTKKPLCIRDNVVGPLIDYIKVPTDIINPLGRVVFKKGDLIPSKIPGNKTLDLCFINGNGNKITTINQINYFKEKVPKCVFLVANYNIMELRKDFPLLKIYPSSIVQEDRFDIKCYPAHIHFYDDKKIYNYYNYNRFKN